MLDEHPRTGGFWRRRTSSLGHGSHPEEEIPAGPNMQWSEVIAWWEAGEIGLATRSEGAFGTRNHQGKEMKQVKELAAKCSSANPPWQLQQSLY